MTNRKKRKLAQAEYGPCYDFCMCWVCWRGWSDMSFRTKLIERIKYIIRERDWCVG